jgi:hypothetical protein
MSRLRIFPPVVELEPNQRQVFVAVAEPPPPMWDVITNLGDIGSDFALYMHSGQTQMGGNGAHKLNSGIGYFEITIDDFCRPITSGGTGQFSMNLFLFDTTGANYNFTLNIAPTSIEVRDELNVQIYTEAYTTVSSDVYRLEGSSGGMRLYRNGVLKFSRTSLGTTIIYPIIWSAFLLQPMAVGAGRIPAPRLIGDWQLMGSAAIEGGHDGVVTFTAPSHGSLTVTNRVMSTEYFGGTIPGQYTLAGQIEAARDPNLVQKATAQIIIRSLKVLGPSAVTLKSSQKARFKTNYSDSLIAWSVVSGGGSFSQGEYTAPALAGDALVRAIASVNAQAADIAISIPGAITNANGYTAAKASEQIDFDHNVSVFPVFISAGLLVSGVGDVVPGLPPGTRLNDILLLFVESANEAVSAPAGWTATADSPQGTGTGGGTTATRLSVFWKRATATETAPTVTDPGDHAIAQILAFRGCVDSGNPWDVTSGDVAAAATTAVSIPGDTTTVVNCLVVLAVSNATDTATPQTSGYANADLVNLTERTDRNSTQGNGGGFAVITGEKAAIGAYGATTATLATSSVQGRISIALKPALITWSASAGSINSTSGLFTAPSQTGQAARITATNGTLSVTTDVPVLDAFPFDPTAVIKWERRKTVLVSTAEDRTRASRIKDKDGLSFDAWELTFSNKTVAELETALAFFDTHYPGVSFIFDDKLRNKRKVVYFDSNIAVEAGSGCDVDFSFRVVEA